MIYILCCTRSSCSFTEGKFYAFDVKKNEFPADDEIYRANEMNDTYLHLKETNIVAFNKRWDAKFSIFNIISPHDKIDVLCVCGKPISVGGADYCKVLSGECLCRNEDKK